MDVLVRTLKPFTVAGLEHRGPFWTVNETWERFRPLAEKAGLLVEGRRLLSVFRSPSEGSSPELQLSYAAIEVPEGLALPGELERIAIPGGEYVGAIHRGPYATLGGIWKSLYEHVPAMTGRDIAQTDSFEVYLNDVRVTPPEELLTELNLPLAPPQIKPGYFQRRDRF